MILEIRLSNFFSIKDEVILDLRAASIKSEQSQNLRNNIFQYKDEEILKTVAIYGANASGKSNIIKAIRFCSSMIFMSHTHNENATFRFMPFKFEGFKNRPSNFFVKFVADEIEYEYSFTLTNKKILKESLYHAPNGRRALVFSRDESLGRSKSKKYEFGKNVIKRHLDVAENTSDKTLYISRASQMDREIPKRIFKFFNEKFILSYQSVNVDRIIKQFSTYNKLLLTALQIADSDIVSINIRKKTVPVKSFKFGLGDNSTSIQEEMQEVLEIFTYHKANPQEPFVFDTEESGGTKKLFYTLLTIIDVVRNGGTLIIDELEDKLHTKILEFILNLFYAGKNAQLIYATHNTNLLNLKKMRKDQIYFVNKKEDASSDLYSLFDYKDFRDTMDVEKAYLQGRFDAIPYIDSSVENLRAVIYG